MSQMAKYVQQYTERGECRCGSCADVGTRPDPVGQPVASPPEERVSDILSGNNHTADVIFFKVAILPGATAEEFKKLTKAETGAFQSVNVLDGEEHSYLELGAWIGDQGMALRYMALGSLLGVFDLLTPKSVLGKHIDDQMAMMMAQQGMVTVAAKKSLRCAHCGKTNCDGKCE